MVNFMLPVLGLAALVPLSAAAPADIKFTAPELSARDFSIQDWISQIAANPEGEHLSIEDATNELLKNTSKNEARSVDRTGELFKRDVVCNRLEEVAYVPDAVACINRLAARGTQHCSVGYGESKDLCTIGNAQVVGVTTDQQGTSSYCQDVARALGGILDQCFRADNTVQGSSYAWGNGYFAVHISAPLV